MHVNELDRAGAGLRDHGDSQYAVECDSAGSRTGRQCQQPRRSVRLIGIGVVWNDRDVCVFSCRRRVIVIHTDRIKTGKTVQIRQSNIQASGGGHVRTIGIRNYRQSSAIKRRGNHRRIWRAVKSAINRHGRACWKSLRILWQAVGIRSDQRRASSHYICRKIAARHLGNRTGWIRTGNVYVERTRYCQLFGAQAHARPDRGCRRRGRKNNFYLGRVDRVWTHGDTHAAGGQIGSV